MEKEIKKLHRYFRLLFYEESLELWKKLSIAICVCGLIFLYLQHQSWNLALSITGLSLFVLEKVVSIYVEDALYRSIVTLVQKYHLKESQLIEYVDINEDPELFILFTAIKETLKEE